MVRVGILLTYPKQEQKKDELTRCRKSDVAANPWIKDVPKEYILERQTRKTVLGTYGVPTDVAVGCSIRHFFQASGVEVDLILPHEINMARLKSNDLNFLMIYDLLEAFHTDKTEDKKLYGVLKKCLSEADNIYPPLKYQEFIYSKINYYNYLKEHDVSILPTVTMTAEEYQELGHENAVKKMLDHIQKENWGRFIAKPVYGQESKDVRFFEPTHKIRIASYFEKCMKKYPGLVLQKAIQDFGCTDKSPELRMYFIGKDYKYSACATKSAIITPESEGGKMKAPLEELKRTTSSIIDKLPEIEMPNGTCLPRLLTRLDMGYMIDGQFKPFVNEVEFVPSLYAENVQNKLVDDFIQGLGRQIVNITKRYVTARATTQVAQQHAPKKAVASKVSASPKKSRHSTSPKIEHPPFKVQCLAKLDKLSVEVTPMKKRKAVNEVSASKVKFARVGSPREKVASPSNVVLPFEAKGLSKTPSACV